MEVITSSDAPMGTPPAGGVPRSAAIEPASNPDAPGGSGPAHDGKPELKPAWCFLAAPVAIGLAVVGLVVAAGAEGPTLTQVIGAALVALWSAAGIALGVRLRRDRLGPIVLAGAVATGVTCLSQSLVESAVSDASSNDTAEILLRMTLGLLPAFALHLFVALPDGRLATPRRRWGVAAGYSVGLIVGGVLCLDLDTVTVWPVVALWGAAFAAGIPAAYGRYRTAGAVDRRRIQWLGWGITVAAEGILVIDGAAAPRRLAERSRDRRAGDDRARPDRDHRRHAAQDGREGRPTAHPHRRARRAHGADSGDLRDRGARASGGRPVAASVRCCCCRWWPPRSPRCCTSLHGVG